MKLKNRQIIWVLVSLTALAACNAGGNNPGIEYAPNMYISDAYEAYSQTHDMKYNPNGLTMRLPVVGTIARGQLDYGKYFEGYEESSSWTADIDATEENVAKGAELYTTFCKHCHGKSGKNDGNVVKLSEFPPPPFANFQTDYIKNLPIGKIFHTITFGKGNMGSHAPQLDPNERWMVSFFVQKLALGDDFVYAEAETTEEEMEVAEDHEGDEEEGTPEEGQGHSDGVEQHGAE